ncbi:sn-glycerol-3-phosphate ABC transporter permease UgpE [Oleispirillum naphthae]|uniref:sn-glycerol-3-phosphate ABC transporter permease UgpE n=1 Tax=Oleispirillum naphthae TaxID=2838853 RepID=UPI0030824D1B
MVENRPFLGLIRHTVLIAGVLLLALPVWLAFVASTQEGGRLLSGDVTLWPSGHFLQTYGAVLFEGMRSAGVPPVGRMMLNSLAMAVLIAVGKIAISLLSAFAIVYFRFPLRKTIFWMIFLTLMLPVEVRIVPTFQVVAGLGLLDSTAGLVLPLIASATATFLFRQFFLSVPPELAEAARIDGAGPMRFFADILVPLSRTNIAALFVILFIYGWNQYLWPFIATTDEAHYTVVMGIQRMVAVPDSEPIWNLVMATAILGMLPPVAVVVAMQKLFVKGLVDSEK